jgi:hypothetical protein
MNTQHVHGICIGAKKRNSKEFWKALKALRKAKQKTQGVKLKQIDFSVRAKYIKGLVCCDKCRRDHLDAWQYKTKTGGFKNICRFCRAAILDMQRGKQDAMNYSVSGGGFGTKR